MYVMLALVASIDVLNMPMIHEDVDGRDKPDHDGVDAHGGKEPAIVKRYREPQAPSLAISGNGDGGGSKRGLSPRIGPARSITLPVVTPAFQAAVE